MLQHPTWRAILQVSPFKITGTVLPACGGEERGVGGCRGPVLHPQCGSPLFCYISLLTFSSTRQAASSRTLPPVQSGQRVPGHCLPSLPGTERSRSIEYNPPPPTILLGSKVPSAGVQQPRADEQTNPSSRNHHTERGWRRRGLRR